MKKYWVYLKNMTLGPFSKAELLALPGFNPTTPVCQEDLAGGDGDWLRADQVAEFRDLFPASASPDAALPPMGLGTALARDLGTPPEFLLYEAQKQIDELHNAIARKESEGGAKEHVMSSLRMELLRKNRQLDELLAERKRMRKLTDDLREGSARKGRQIEAMQNDIEHLRSQVRDLRQAQGRKAESSEQESRVSEALLDWFLTHFRPKGTLQAKAVRKPKPRLKPKVDRLLSAFEEPAAQASAAEEGPLSLGTPLGAEAEESLGSIGAPEPAAEGSLGSLGAPEPAAEGSLGSIGAPEPAVEGSLGEPAAEGSLGAAGSLGGLSEGLSGGMSEGLSLSGDADAPLSFSLDGPEPEAQRPPQPEPAEEIEFLPTALEAGMEPSAEPAPPPPPAPVPEEKPVEAKHVFAGLEFIPPPPRRVAAPEPEPEPEPPAAAAEVPAFDPADFADPEPVPAPAELAAPPPAQAQVPLPATIAAGPEAAPALPPPALPSAQAARAVSSVPAPDRKRRAALVLGVTVLVLGAAFAARWKWRGVPAAPPVPAQTLIPAVPAAPAPASRTSGSTNCASDDKEESARCRSALERVQTHPAVQGMTVKAFLESIATPQGKRTQRWEVLRTGAGVYRVDFLAGIPDPATNAELVYSFRADLGRGGVKGLNMPAEAVLPTP